MFRSTFAASVVFFILFAGCSSRQPVKDTLTLRELHQLYYRAVRRNKAVDSLRATGFFSWKDNKDEFNFLVRIRYDKASSFTRLELRGTLDDTYWADLVVLSNRVKLFMPLQKRLYTGVRKGFSLHPFTGIHIKLSELLPLMQGKYYFIPNAALHGGRVVNDEARLTAVAGDRLLQTGFSLQSGKPVRSRLFTSGKLQGEITYQSYRSKSGLELPAKKVLNVYHPIKGRAVLWLSSWNTNYIVKKNDRIIAAASNVQAEKIGR